MGANRPNAAPVMFVGAEYGTTLHDVIVGGVYENVGAPKPLRSEYDPPLNSTKINPRPPPGGM